MLPYPLLYELARVRQAELQREAAQARLARQVRAASLGQPGQLAHIRGTLSRLIRRRDAARRVSGGETYTPEGAQPPMGRAAAGD